MSRIGLANYSTYDPPAVGLPEPNTLTTYSENSFGIVTLSAGAVFASGVWPLASEAFFFPIVLKRPRTYNVAIWANGTVVSGNVDVGVYDASGAKMFSLGSTLQAGVSTSQQAALSAAQLLNPGRYFLAMAMDNVTGTIANTSPHFGYLRCYGARLLTAAFPLPASVSGWVGCTTSWVPLFGISELATL